MLTLTHLNEVFNDAKENGAKFVAVQVSMGSNNRLETIINPAENIEYKQVYYNNVYDESLVHRFAQETIKIVSFAYGNTFQEIQEKLDLFNLVKQNY